MRASSIRSRQNRFVYTFLIPIMLFFLVFNIVPIVASALLSLYNYSPISRNPPFVGLRNYISMFTDAIFLKTVSNTFVLVIVGVAGNILIATSVAVAINSIASRGSRDLFRTIYFLPTIAPIAAVAIVFRYMLDPRYGIHNMILGILGEQKMVYWLSDPTLAMGSVIVMTLWQDFGINMVIILAGLYSIPHVFYEASLIDGATKWQQFWRITLPLLVRTMLFVSVMTVIAYFQIFTQVRILTDGKPDFSTQVIALSIYQDAFERLRMGYASAMAVVLLIIIMIASLVQFRAIKVDWEY